jgi:hypothetical protein
MASTRERLTRTAQRAKDAKKLPPLAAITHPAAPE